MVLESLQDGLQDIFGEIGNVVTNNPIAVGSGVAGAGIIAGGIMALSTIKSKTKTKRKTSKKTSRNRKSKKRTKHYHHGKRHSHKGKGKIGYSHKKIHYTKHKQPYIILASGKARFIKKTKRRTK